MINLSIQAHKGFNSNLRDQSLQLRGVRREWPISFLSLMNQLRNHCFNKLKEAFEKGAMDLQDFKRFSCIVHHLYALNYISPVLSLPVLKLMNKLVRILPSRESKSSKVVQPLVSISNPYLMLKLDERVQTLCPLRLTNQLTIKNPKSSTFSFNQNFSSSISQHPSKIFIQQSYQKLAGHFAIEDDDLNSFDYSLASLPSLLDIALLALLKRHLLIRYLKPSEIEFVKEHLSLVSEDLIENLSHYQQWVDEDDEDEICYNALVLQGVNSQVPSAVIVFGTWYEESTDCISDTEEEDGFKIQVGSIESLKVLPSEQKKGFGKLLLLSALSKMKSLGVSKVILDAESEGLKLYDSVGFRSPYMSKEQWDGYSFQEKLADLKKQGDLELDLEDVDFERLFQNQLASAL